MIRLLMKSALGLMAVVLVAGCASNAAVKPERWEPARRAQAHVDLGLDYLRRGQFDVARKEFDLAISIDPRSDKAYHAQGLLMAQTGFKPEAKKLLGKAVSLNPSNYLAVNDYGIYLCDDGEFEKGIAALERVLEEPDNQIRVNTRLGLGVCHFQKNELEEAKLHLRSVLQANPRLPQALLPMAEISYRQSNFLSARAFVERTVAIGAISERILIAGANTELQLGDRDKASQYARELRRLYPNSSSLSGFRPLLTGG